MKERTNATVIGFITVASYIANYFLRNMLSVLTPYMVKNPNYTTEYLAMLSSVYMIAYAAGQLFNGILGDFIKPKKMVLIGLIAAGTSTAVFPAVGHTVLKIACFAILGYSLSMLRGPLMKIITENTKPAYARIICVLFSFASFAGPMIAGLIAMIFHWQEAFVFAGILTVAIGVMAFLGITVLEKRNIIAFKKVDKLDVKSMLDVFKIKGFAFYIIIACVVEIAATSISFYIPSFMNEYAHFTEAESNMVFSAISLVRALVPFVTLAVYAIMGERDILITKLAYAISIIAFAATFFVPVGYATVLCLLVALVMNSVVSALLWSIYIPGLGKTGRVSSVNGILDCTGYVAASAATLVFARVVTYFSWKGLIVAWAAIPVIGIVAAIIFGKELEDKKA